MRLGGIKAQAITLAAASAVAAAVNIGVPSISPVRVVLAIPLVLGPGFAVSASLFPPRSLSGSERLAVIGGMDLAVVVFLGLALDATPGGLNRTSWSVGLALVTIVASGTMVLAHRGTAQSHTAWGLPLKPTIAGLSGLAIAAAGVVVARESAVRHEQRTKFTELWELPGTPFGRAVRYGVTNREGRREVYRVVARDPDGRVVFRSGWFRLGPGATRTGRFVVAPPLPVAVRVDLFRATGSQTRPYRTTRLELNATHPG